MQAMLEDIKTDEEAEQLEENLEQNQEEQPLTFAEKFATWDPNKALRVKDPRAKAYVLDQIFWNHPLHHQSPEFYTRVLGFIKKTIERYGIEEQQTDEDLPVQIYSKICEAINGWYDPYKANVVTFLHAVLFNHIKLRAYHINKYKDGTFYNRFYTYDSIIKSITKSVTTTDYITLDNYFDHLNYTKVGFPTREYLKNDLIKIAPKNNILFKAVVWELLQNSEEMNVGRFNNKFNNRRDTDSIQERRAKIRRS